MTQEEYLRIKEYKIRLGLVILLFTIFAILGIVLILTFLDLSHLQQQYGNSCAF